MCETKKECKTHVCRTEEQRRVEFAWTATGSDNCSRSSNERLSEEYSGELEIGRVALEHSETPDELSDPLSEYIHFQLCTRD